MSGRSAAFAVSPWLVGAVVALGGCRQVSPCAPCVGWGLAELADAPGQRVEACTPGRFTFRVMPGGSREAWLRELGRYPRSGWVVWRQAVLVRRGDPAVVVDVRPEGRDLVIELRPEGSIDVEAALAGLQVK